MYGILLDIPFYINPFHSGILVRDDAAKTKLEQRLQGSIIMLGLTFMRQTYT